MDKRKNNEKIFIINAKIYKFNTLEKIKITELNQNYELLNKIIADKANIENNLWVLKNVIMFNEEKQNKLHKLYNYKSSYNGKIISNLYSNLNSLNIFELLKLKQNYKDIGYLTEIKLHLNALQSTYIFGLNTIIGSLLMFKFNNIKSKFLVVIGVIVSVVFYYINYFAMLLKK